ncbi:MAG: COX15/CtaA family protein [Chloroflexota bacterium]|nr:COX15/CtaA family protein [Chloroflexota bacterium]
MAILRGLALASTLGMWLVLVMGAAVTNTGSSQGCGRSWPLCNGQFVPEFTLAAAIEYSHRAVTGIVGILIVALAAAVLARWRQRTEAQVLVPLMLGSLLLQAGLGAAAVIAPQSPPIMASHFGISLICFGTTLLVAVFIFDEDRAPAGGGSIPSGFRRAVLASGVYVLLVVYLGAFVRHSGASLACFDWPLCNGQVVPALDGATGIVFAHRLSALGLILLLGCLAAWARAIPACRATTLLALLLAIVQASSGGLIVTTRLGLFSTLAHAGIMALLFGVLALLTRQVVVGGAIEPIREPAAASLARA